MHLQGGWDDVEVVLGDERDGLAGGCPRSIRRHTRVRGRQERASLLGRKLVHVVVAEARVPPLLCMHNQTRLKDAVNNPSTFL